jgi:hypothetical protein
MTEKHLILCGGAKLSSRNKAWRESKPIRLELGKGEKQLHLRLHHITRRLASQIPAVAVDLLEIATYVYAADQMVSRGGLKEFEYGTKWRRQFRLEIPVRLPDKWNDPKMISLLEQTIGFLSDDDYEFHFTSFKTQNETHRDSTLRLVSAVDPSRPDNGRRTGLQGSCRAHARLGRNPRNRRP